MIDKYDTMLFILSLLSKFYLGHVGGVFEDLLALDKICQVAANRLHL